MWTDFPLTPVRSILCDDMTIIGGRWFVVWHFEALDYGVWTHRFIMGPHVFSTGLN